MQGEYGIEKTYCGVIVKLGAQGIELIAQLELNPKEQELFKKSAQSVGELVQKLKAENFC